MGGPKVSSAWGSVSKRNAVSGAFAAVGPVWIDLDLIANFFKKGPEGGLLL